MTFQFIDPESFRNIFGDADVERLVRQALLLSWILSNNKPDAVNEAAVNVRQMLARAIEELQADPNKFCMKDIDISKLTSQGISDSPSTEENGHDDNRSDGREDQIE